MRNKLSLALCSGLKYRSERLFLIMVVSLIAVVSLSACSPNQDHRGNENKEPLLLLNARIVDVAKQEVRSGSLLIVDGKLAAELQAQPPDFSGKIVDLKERWVIPGFIDMHVHAYGNMSPNAYESPGTEAISKRLLYAGVTGFLDLFGDEQGLIKVRERQRAGLFFGADVFASLSCLTAPAGHCTEYSTPTRTLTSAEQAETVVTELAKQKPDVIKLVYQPSDDQPSIDKPTFQRAVATASALNIPTVVHIKTWQDVRDAIAVGASAITHMPQDPIPGDLPKLMAAAGLISIPTLTVHTDFTEFVFDASVLAQPLAQAMATEEVINDYASREVIDRIEKYRATLAAYKTQQLQDLNLMHQAGVQILTGTDAGNRGTLQGYSLHRELLKLTQAGLTPWQALSAATTEPRNFLGIKNGFAEGSQASFVVLNTSPLEAIQNTQDIFMVIHHGKIVDREKQLKESFY